MCEFLNAEDRKNPALVKAVESFQDCGGIDSLSIDVLGLSHYVETYDPDDIRDDSGEPSIDCRLRYHDGRWSFLTGDSSYDQDHRGHWGCSCVGANLCIEDACSIAHELVEQVLESIAMSEGGE